MLSAVILACALASAGPATAAPLGQAGTGTITGQVMSLDNVPLPNVRLAAYAQPQETPNRTPLAEFTSDAQGRYSVSVPAGQVWVEFLTQDIRGQSFWGYSNLPVSVAAGQTVADQNFVVAIRIVSEPATQPPGASTPPAPGMPRTGAGLDPALPLGLGIGLALMTLLFGVMLRRFALR
jgi:hypothetical protein